MPSISSSAHNQYLRYMNVSRPVTVAASILDKSIVTATHLSRSEPGHGFIGKHATEDAFMMSVRLRDYEADIWVDGKKVDFPLARAGSFTLYDYNNTWTSDIKSPFDNVSFHIPRAALEALSEDFRGKTVEVLRIQSGSAISAVDPTVSGLVHAMLPAFDRPREVSRLFMDHIALALSIHMAVSYGEAGSLSPVLPGGLAAWQIKTATEMIEAQLDGNLSLAQLSQACRLSPSYFARAFKISLGMTPHRWMLNRRIERAKHLMRTTKLSLAEIGAVSGFQSQSHFSRAFRRIVGAAAIDWRYEVS